METIIEWFGTPLEELTPLGWVALGVLMAVIASLIFYIDWKLDHRS